MHIERDMPGKDSEILASTILQEEDTRNRSNIPDTDYEGVQLHTSLNEDRPSPLSVHDVFNKGNRKKSCMETVEVKIGAMEVNTEREDRVLGKDLENFGNALECSQELGLFIKPSTTSKDQIAEAEKYQKNLLKRID